MATTTDYVELRCRSAFSFLDGASLPEDLVAAAADGGHRRAGARRSRRRLRRAALLRGGAQDRRCGRSSAPSHAGRRRPAPRAAAGRGSRRLPEPLPAAHRARKGPRKAEAGRRRDPRSAGRARGRADRARGRGAARRSAGAASTSSAAIASTSRCTGTSTPTQAHRNARPCWPRPRRCGIGVVATNDVRYATPAQRIVHDVLTCARAKTHRRRDRAAPAAQRRALAEAARATMAALFRDRPAAVRATRDIAERCAFTLADLGYVFPAIRVPAGETRAELPREASPGDGVRTRYDAGDPILPKVRRQLARELASSARWGWRATSWWSGTSSSSRARAGIMVQGRGLGGELGRLLRAGHHRRRSGADGPAVRTLPVGGARRRPPTTPPTACPTSIWICRRANGARRSSSTSTQVRRARRRHDRERDHLPAAHGGARRGARARLLRGAAQSHRQAPARRGSDGRRRADRGPHLAMAGFPATDHRTRLLARWRPALLEPAPPPGPALGRHGDRRRPPGRGRAAGAGEHARPGGRAVGQGRLRRPRHREGRPAGAGHAGGAGGRRAADPAPRRRRRRLRPPAARRSEGVRDAARRRHRRRVPGRVARADGDAAAHEARALLRPGGRGGDHPARAHRRQDGQPVPRSAATAASRCATRTRRWSRS